MNTLPLWAALPVAALLVASGITTLTGCIGLLRFKTFYTRIHAPTLGNTLGAACLLAASIIVSLVLDRRPIFHEVLILFFLIVTSPVTTIVLIQAARRRDRQSPPAPARETESE